MGENAKTLRIADINDIEIEALWMNAQKDTLYEVTMRFPECYHIKPVKFSETLMGVFDIREGDPADGFGEPNVIVGSFGKLVNAFSEDGEPPEDGEGLSFTAVYRWDKADGNPENILFFPPQPGPFETVDFLKDGLINAFEIKEDDSHPYDPPRVYIRFYGKYKESFAYEREGGDFPD